jgi:hypothetical protein
VPLRRNASLNVCYGSISGPSGADNGHVTSMDMGGGMRTYNGNIGGQPLNGTDMNLGGGMRTFNGNIGGSHFNTTCTTFGGITTCN